ncbi:hypothetical protein BDZ89DRAFT_1133667 [Hymenopellis radicata]|nr:hypothetical protein BDZ89DRAFT_1133667 [Hymenopellis radicata]
MVHSSTVVTSGLSADIIEELNMFFSSSGYLFACRDLWLVRVGCHRLRTILIIGISVREGASAADSVQGIRRLVNGSRDTYRVSIRRRKRVVLLHALWDPATNAETRLPDMPKGVARVYPASGGVAMLPFTPENNYTPTILFCGGTDMPDYAWGN